MSSDAVRHDEKDAMRPLATTTAWVVNPIARAWPPIADAPTLSSAAAPVVKHVAVADETGERRSVQMPIERPLLVVVDGMPQVTLMTLGAAPEWLVLGYLRNQRRIDSPAELDSIAIDWSIGTAVVTSRHGVSRAAMASPSPMPACALGSAFLSIERIAPMTPLQLSDAALLTLLDTVQAYDAIHRAAGSVHSCALFAGADLWVAVEDVSRHNGIDTVVGWMAHHGVAGGDKILFTTGRLTAEMVLKAAHNGISFMVSRNGVSSLGHEIATKLGVGLVARAAKRRFLRYTPAT